MYWVDKYLFKTSIEYEYKWVGNYGAKGEKRKPKEKETPEQIKRQNQINKETRVRRLIKMNFTEDDFWVTLKHPRGTRITIEEAQKEMNTFVRRLRAKYKKMDEELKFISRLEIGKRGGIHAHIIINRSKGRPDTDRLIREAWTFGTVHFEGLHEAGGYVQLASYICKLPPDDNGQIEMFSEQEKRALGKYSRSRNLKEPVKERKVYRRWTVRRLIEEGPKPTQGYFIDKDSIRQGVNRYTGMSYLYYTEIKIKRREPPG